MNQKTNQKTNQNQEQTKTPEIKRVFKGDIEVFHDLFKLEVSKAKKNISFDLKKPTLIDVEHCHFYHTCDSKGKPMSESTAALGHKHKISVSVDDKGNLIAECGPCINGLKVDQHVHKIHYIRSEKFKTRETNAKASKFFTEFDKPLSDNKAQ